MGNTVVWKPAGTAMLSAYYLMRLFQEAGLPDGVVNLVYGAGATIGDAALASPHLAGIHFTGSTPVFNGMWRTVASNMEHYRNYPRIVGETGGKDFIVAHPTADLDALATAIVRGSFEYQGQKCSAVLARLRAVEPLAGAPRAPAGGGRDDQDRRRHGLPQLHGRGDRRRVVQDAGGGDRGREASTRDEIVVGGGYDDSRRLLRRADGDRDARPRLPPDARGDLRPGRDDLRLRREQLGRHARARSTGRRRTGSRARSSREDRAAVADAQRRLRYAAGNFYVNDKPTGAVVGQQPFGGARASGHERQGGLDVEPHPLGQPAHDQGDVRAADDYRYPFLGDVASTR